jgi:hypothetical protein
MDQKREPPSYQEYPAAILSNIQFRTMSLEERGLLYTMRLECWVNKSLPAEPATLARVLGYGRELIDNVLPLVLSAPFFDVVDSKIICPELENYRAYLDERKAKQSAGGKRGADIANAKRPKPKSRISKGSEGTPAGTPQPTRRGEVESLVQYNPVQTSKTQPLEHAGITDPWVADYERASNG